ncbi:MAG: hypothetical protein QGI00_03490 [Candidatus Marinimicrobia bacterium]|nr:hypothetical protein [Candidatus Neomarinimicrobiota bacterium]
MSDKYFLASFSEHNLMGQFTSGGFFYAQSWNGSSSITISYSDVEGGQDSIVTNDNATITWGDGNKLR